MHTSLDQILRELEAFGAANDARETERERRMLNITRDTGAFLALLVRATRAKRVLEIGTSNGYSTLWLADAVRDLGGCVVTVERSLAKVAMARANLERGGVASLVEIVHDEAAAMLERSAPACFDFVFLDSAREHYEEWWPRLARVLSPGGLIVADNALSHETEMAPFVEMLGDERGVTLSIVPVGNGELLVHRA